MSEFSAKQITGYSLQFSNEGKVVTTISPGGVVSFNSDLSPEEGSEQAWATLMDMAERHNCGVAALQAENVRLREALEGALSTIEDYASYYHDGDPWSEDARVMGEMDIDDYMRDGRHAAARAALKQET